MKNFKTKNLVILSLLIALEIVLSRFLSINTWNIKIGFSFVPVVIAAMLFGPVYAGIVAAFGDFLGAILFPIGAYFPGFTLSAFCVGAVFGLLLKSKPDYLHVMGAVLISQIVFSLFLNTAWISVLYGAPYLPTLATRIVQCAILIPVQFVLICLIAKAMPQLRRAVNL